LGQPSKHEALSSNPSTAQRKRERERERERGKEGGGERRENEKGRKELKANLMISSQGSCEIYFSVYKTDSRATMVC
jgi:hypothetical protein